MAQIPLEILDACPKLDGLPSPTRGKVRDCYELPDHPDKLLPVATKRISIFDFVLNGLVQDKGKVLNAMNIFWRRLIQDFCPHDLVAYGARIDEYLPESLRGNTELQCSATVVRKLKMLPVECIVRGYLTGSGWKDYQKNRTVSGHVLPEGLHDGSRLPYPIFTPSTKAEVGHDMPLDGLNLGDYLVLHCSHEELGSKNQDDHTIKCHQLAAVLERLSLQLYQFGAHYALERDLILADTKFEFGLGPNGHLDVVLGDEVLTPDSSRYWDFVAWKKSQPTELPSSLDKQFVRNWGKIPLIAIDKRKPEVDADVVYVHRQFVPDAITAKTTQLYRYIFWRLTGRKLEQFQSHVMEVEVESSPVKVLVLLGSASDKQQAALGISHVAAASSWCRAELHKHVISCHRNPDDLRNFIEDLYGVDVIVAGAGKAAALPGVVASWLDHFGKSHIPVIGVAFKGSTDEDDLTAKLSIKGLPDKSAVLDKSGYAFFGEQGMVDACTAAMEWEFLSRTPSKKEPEWDF